MKVRDLPAAIFQAMQRSTAAAPVVARLAAGGVALTEAKRTELLAKAVAREHVELEVDVLAYEQAPNERNRTGVRFRDGAMVALGRSGAGKPFLRDHRQDDSTARGGTILASRTVKVGEGAYRIEQTIRLTDPSAVERALRGLMSAVSIAWLPTGSVTCSACGTAILEKCWHWPLDIIAGVDDALDQVVEWVFTAAELVETSEVSVPAVPRARIEAVRAAALAAFGSAREPSTLSALAAPIGLRTAALADLDAHLRRRRSSLDAAIAMARRMGVAGEFGRVEDLVLRAAGFTGQPTPAPTPLSPADRVRSLAGRPPVGCTVDAAIAMARRMGARGSDEQLEALVTGAGACDGRGK